MKPPMIQASWNRHTETLICIYKEPWIRANTQFRRTWIIKTVAFSRRVCRMKGIFQTLSVLQAHVCFQIERELAWTEMFSSISLLLWSHDVLKGSLCWVFHYIEVDCSICDGSINNENPDCEISYISWWDHEDTYILLYDNILEA